MSPVSNVRIVVADDHGVVRQGLRELLDSTIGMEVVGEAADGAEALARVREHRPDLLLLDLNMPGPGGAKVCEEVRETSPETRVLVLTMHGTPGQVHRLVEAGATGYAVKKSSIEDVLDAIRAVVAGGIWIDPMLAGEILGGAAKPKGGGELDPDVLSSREEEVLRRVAWGHPNKTIGEMLGISTRTVETYKARIRDKLGLQSRADMVRYAVDQGWLSSQAPPDA